MAFGKKYDIAIDLGTANTLIYVKGEGIVLNEPSVIAKDIYRDVIIAAGADAKEMLGKAPENIQVVRPLREGVISDFDMTADMLATFFKRVTGDGGKVNARVAVGVPNGVTEVEKRAVSEVLEEMGCREVYILDEPLAAALGSGMNIDGTNGCLIIDIGGGTTDIAVITLGGIVACTSIRYAGDNFNEAVIQYYRRHNALLIGEASAEKTKIDVGTAMIEQDEFGNDIVFTSELSGRDIISGLPKTITITNLELFEALEESMQVIVDGIKATIEKTPIQISADIAKDGAILAGGGALIQNLDKYIQKKTGIKTTISENPKEAVVLGGAKGLEDIEKLKLYIKQTRR